MELYVGLDVHSKQSVFVIEDEDGNVVARGEVPTSREGMERLRSEHALPTGRCGAGDGDNELFRSARAFQSGASSRRRRCARGAAEGPPTDPEE
jgi:hypothetical protein